MRSKVIPVFCSSIPFHHSIPLIHDSLPLSSTQVVHQTIQVVLHNPKKGLVRTLPMPQVACELLLSGYCTVNVIPKDYFLGCILKLRTRFLKYKTLPDQTCPIISSSSRLPFIRFSTYQVLHQLFCTQTCIHLSIVEMCGKGGGAQSRTQTCNVQCSSACHGDHIMNEPREFP